MLELVYMVLMTVSYAYRGVDIIKHALKKSFGAVLFLLSQCSLSAWQALAAGPLSLTPVALVAVYENHYYKWLSLVTGCLLKRACIVGPYLEVKIFCSLQEMNRNDSCVSINNLVT